MNTHLVRLAVLVTLVVCLFSCAFFYAGCDTDGGEPTQTPTATPTPITTPSPTPTVDGAETQVNFLVEEYLDNSFLSRIDASIPGAFSGITLARAYHETQGYYELSFTQTAYDVDDNMQWTTDELEGEIDPNDLYTWPNVLNLTLLYDENAALLSTLLTSLAAYDQNGAIDSQIMSALNDGARIFLARDFITTLVRGDEVYTEIPYFLFINLDMHKIDAVAELQGYNPADPFPDAPVIHDPHVEKLIQLLIQGADLNGDLWQMCLRGNEKKQKFQAVVVSKDDSGEYDIQLMTATCEDCCLGEKYQFNPPFYPKKVNGAIPVIVLGDMFNPGQNPNINLNKNLGQPAVGLAQGNVPGLVDQNPIVPVPEDDIVITPGEEQESESETADGLSQDPCCQSWSSFTPSLEEIDCHLNELEKLKKSFEYWNRSQYGTENMDPVVQQVLDIQDFVNSHYALNQNIFYNEVYYRLAFDDEYQTMVLDELENLISQCSGCSKSSDIVEIRKGNVTETAETVSINCDCDCDDEDACLYKNPLENPDYTQRKDCLQDAIDSLQGEIDDLSDDLQDLYNQFPQIKLLLLRTTIWDNIFYEGVEGIDARAFCPSMGGPATQDYGVDDFFHNVYLGIVANNQSVDEAIDNAITEEMRQSPEAAGLVQCALTQLKQSLKTAYRNKLEELDYSEEKMDILMDKELTPAQEQALAHVETLRKHIHLKELLRNKILLAMVGMDRKQAECAKTYMEKKHCELTTVMAMMGGFKQSVASGVLDFGMEFRTNIPHCDICEGIQRLACCHGGNPACTSACEDYPADCCTDFEFPCGFMRYLICFGKSALDAGEVGEDVLFCPEFEYNSDPCCEGNTCITEEVCEDTCLKTSK